MQLFCNPPKSTGDEKVTEKEFNVEAMSIHKDAQAMLHKAKKEDIETAWDRLQNQSPQCKFGDTGICCRICVMGPCRISKKAPLGVCGADADVIVSRNFGRFLCGGAAGHSDHGRDCIEALEAIVEGKTNDYTLANPEKLLAVASELGIATENRDVMEVGRDLVDVFYSDFASRKKELAFLCRVPQKRKENGRNWASLPAAWTGKLQR